MLDYIKNNRWKTALALLSIAIAFLLSSFLSSGLKEGNHYVRVGLLDHGNNSKGVANILINKQYGTDKLEISLSLSKNNGDQNTFSISLPKSFKRIDSSSSGIEQSNTKKIDELQYWHYEITSNNAFLRETFSGNVLSSTGPYNSTRLAPDYLNKPIPTKFTLTNIGKPEILYGTPEPNFNSEYALVYDTRTISDLGNDEIVLRTVDYDAQSQHAIQLVLLGIVLGICGSIVAGWLYEYMGEKDRHRNA